MAVATDAVTPGVTWLHLATDSGNRPCGEINVAPRTMPTMRSRGMAVDNGSLHNRRP